jgi:hypothetical protein
MELFFYSRLYYFPSAAIRSCVVQRIKRKKKDGAIADPAFRLLFGELFGLSGNDHCLFTENYAPTQQVSYQVQGDFVVLTGLGEYGENLRENCSGHRISC